MTALTVSLAVSVTGSLAVSVLAPDLASAASSEHRGGDRATRGQIVATTEFAAELVRMLVSESTEIDVLLPTGTDPHEWQPSAADVATLDAASLVVSNGGVEVHLADPLRQRVGPTFALLAHVPVLAGADEHDGSVAATDDGHASGSDPHIWTDPMTMAAALPDLAATLEQAGFPVGDRLSAAIQALAALDAEVAGILAAVPPAQRKLVTGHESLAYFAKRYQFELIGAVIPSLTSAADVSAAQLASLHRAIATAGVKAVFTELGTPAATATAVAADSGAKLVELETHALPANGGYRQFMRNLASTIATALTT